MKLKGFGFALIICFAVNIVFAQSGDWTIENGKALARKTIAVTGKNSNDIYKEVNRWLVKYFRDPEDNLKARIDGEYIRGIGYHRGVKGPDKFGTGNLKYTYIFEVVDEQVTFSITEVIFYESSVQDLESGTYGIEDFITHATSKRNNSDATKMLSSLTEFSDQLFKSFESSLFSK